MKTVAICILTNRRPEGLQRLLGALALLEAPDTDTWNVEVVVVDNDPDASAKSTVERHRDLLPWQLTYIVEPRPGIAVARNRALNHAVPRHDAIAFIDDDESPGTRWLRELLRAQAQYRADVVAGPVEPRFEQPAPRWMVDGGLFNRRRHPTGTRLQYVATGNLLMLGDTVAAYRFEESLSLLGGEDTLLSMQLYAAGKMMVWADEAVVFEWNPSERTTLRWLIRRGFQLGNSMVAAERCFGAGPWRRIVRLAKGSGLLVGALLTLPLAAALGRSGLARSLVRGARGAGTVAGFIGVRFAAYGRPPAQNTSP